MAPPERRDDAHPGESRQARAGHDAKTPQGVCRQIATLRRELGNSFVFVVIPETAPEMRDAQIKVSPLPQCDPIMKLYHKTWPNAARQILAEGFRDFDNWGVGPGVWVSNLPWPSWVEKMMVFEIEVSDISRERMFYEFEVCEAGKPCREFVIPAEILNRSVIREMSDDEVADFNEDAAWNDYPIGEPGIRWTQLQRDDDRLVDDPSFDLCEA